MSELFKSEDEKELIKNLIRGLHKGVPLEDLESKFKSVVKKVTPSEISQVEEELIREGIPAEEIRRFCDIHIKAFRESIERETILVPQSHPVKILMEEHKLLLNYGERLREIVNSIRNSESFDAIRKEMENLEHINEHFKDSESHYVREENVLFPHLEKHGITQPPAIMWMEHDEIRKIKKRLSEIIEDADKSDIKIFIKNLSGISTQLSENLSSHFYKENNILFPTALEVIPDSEWKEIRDGFGELGYCCFTPQVGKLEIKEEVSESEPKEERRVNFEIGSLKVEEIESIFNTIPFDATFIDKDDSVAYFNRSEERIFPRTKSVIGRKVQQCHPPKSVHVVNKILDDFKNGDRNSADFWIDKRDRLVYIRYFPVRDKNNNYLGTLEVTQDITDIKKIEGEKRLLD